MNCLVKEVFEKPKKIKAKGKLSSQGAAQDMKMLFYLCFLWPA